MPALVVGVLPNFSPLHLTWALPRLVATYHLREQGFAHNLTNPCKVLALPTTFKKGAHVGGIPVRSWNEHAMTRGRSGGVRMEQLIQTSQYNNPSLMGRKNSWTVFQLSYAVGTRVTSVLQMKDFTLDEWRRLPKVRSPVGHAGQPMLRLWEWTLSYRTLRSQSESASSKGLRDESERGTMVEANKSKLEAHLAQSRPLDRRSRWPQIPTLQK